MRRHFLTTICNRYKWQKRIHENCSFHFKYSVEFCDHEWLCAIALTDSCIKSFERLFSPMMKQAIKKNQTLTTCIYTYSRE